MPESNPPDYTERAGPEPVEIPGLDEESSNPDPDQTREVRSEERQEAHPEGGQGTPLIEPKPEDEANDHPETGENIDEAPREEVRPVQVTLDPEITKTIRRMARDQREL